MNNTVGNRPFVVPTVVGIMLCLGLTGLAWVLPFGKSAEPLTEEAEVCHGNEVAAAQRSERERSRLPNVAGDTSRSQDERSRGAIGPAVSPNQPRGQEPATGDAASDRAAKQNGEPGPARQDQAIAPHGSTNNEKRAKLLQGLRSLQQSDVENLQLRVVPFAGPWHLGSPFVLGAELPAKMYLAARITTWPGSLELVRSIPLLTTLHLACHGKVPATSGLLAGMAPDRLSVSSAVSLEAGQLADLISALPSISILSIGEEVDALQTVGPSDLAAIAEHPALRSLEAVLSATDITPDDWKSAFGNSNLCELKLTIVAWSESWIQAVLSMTLLEDVTLAYTSNSDSETVGFLDLRGLASMKKLRSFRMLSDRLPCWGVARFPVLANLQHLRLETRAPFRGALEAIGECKSLASLALGWSERESPKDSGTTTVSSVGPSIQDARLFERLVDGLSLLEKIEIHCGWQGETDVSCLGSLNHLKAATFGGMRADSLTGLGSLRNVEALRFRNCAISESVRSAVNDMQGLRVLGFDNCTPSALALVEQLCRRAIALEYSRTGTKAALQSILESIAPMSGFALWCDDAQLYPRRG